MQSYLELGTKWLLLFREKKLEFVGEIQLDAEELRNLCGVLRRDYGESQRPEFCSALTVAVINLAYYSSKDLDTGRFTEYVLSQLAPDSDGRFWREYIGKPVTHMLESYFQVESRSGSHRYVTPIKQQAGIPASAENSFLKFFCELLHNYGTNFVDDKYDQALAVLSTESLEPFLTSHTGRRFCRDLARVVSNRRAGIFHEQAFDGQPRFRNLVEKVWERLPAEPSPAKCRLPQPKLVLDLNRNRLAVEFSSRGLDGGYCWGDGARVNRHLVYLEATDFADGLRGQIRQPDDSLDQWEVEVWQPDACQWAAFRAGEGSWCDPRARKEQLPPGRYWLVVPASVRLTTPARVYANCGGLSLPIANETAWVIFDCELPPGFQIPAIGLSVEVGLEITPTLSFARFDPLPFAHHVFIGALPELRINGWCTDFADRFFVLLDDGGQRKAIYPSGETFCCPLSAPSQGELRIEPKGRTPRGFEAHALHFTLLPSNARIEWPIGLLHSGEEALIEFQPSEQFSVCWEDERLESIGPCDWLVPPTVDYVEGVATFRSSISFPVYGAINRFSISGQAIKEGVLWRTSFKQKSHLELNFSPVEAGQSVVLGLLANNELLRAVELSGCVPSHGTLRCSSEAVCDAITGAPIIAAPLAIRLLGGRTFVSQVIYIDEHKLVASLRETELREFEALAGNLPEWLQKLISQIRKLRAAPLADFRIQPGAWPELLANFINQVMQCREVLDDNVMHPELSLAQDRLCATLKWCQDVKRLLAEPQPYAPLIIAALRERAPQDLSALPFERWRSAVRRLKVQLHAIKDWPTLLKEWVEYCRQQSWRAAGNTQVGQMPGGGALTDGAKNYFYALERKASGQMQGLMDGLGAARSKLEQAQNEAGQGIILEIASTLRAMVFYHAGHQTFQNEANAVINLLSPQWNQLCQTLRYLQQPNQQRRPDDGTLGLATVSPHPMDIELEERIK